ncbi:MAG TPA: hypothetical protein VIK89_13375 [Cytophagaceae bacterium]
MKTIFLLISLSWSLFLRNTTDPVTLKAEGKSLDDLIPKGWVLLDSAYGDLNKDGIKDLAFVIQDTNPSNLEFNDNTFGNDTINLNPRILGIYFGNSTGAFKKQLQSNDFIILRDSPTMDEPFDGLTISDKGILQINFHFWYSAGSWYASDHSYKFRFQNSKFALIGYDSHSAHRATGETTDYSINFLTRKMSITKGNFSEDKPESVEWKSFNLTNLKTLDSYGKPFEWEFEGIVL